MTNDEYTPEVELDETENNNEELDNQELHQETEDDVDWKSEALKYKAILNRNKEKKEKTPEIQSTQQDTLTPKDMYALTQANVHFDDFDEVTAYAKFKGISVAEALQSDVIKVTLSQNAQFRKTAQVSNTNSAKQSQSKVSDETLMANLRKGEIPEVGSEEAERLFWAKRGGKR